MCFLVVFAIFWTALVGAFDAFVGYQWYKSEQTMQYQVTEGVITHSQVTTHRDSDGTTYGKEAQYTYTVDGHEYMGDRISFSEWSSSNRREHQSWVNDHSAGTVVEVYYDGDDPSEAVLERGVSQMLRSIVIFLMVFNLVAVGLWWMVVRSFLLKRDTRPAGGLVLGDDGGVAKLRMTMLSPIGIGFATSVGLAFVSSFVSFFVNMTTDMMGIFLIVVLGAGAGAGMVAWAWRSSYDKVLVVDGVNRRVWLESGKGRALGFDVAMDAIRRIGIKEETTRSNDGTSTSHHLAISWDDEDGERQVKRLRQFMIVDRGERVADWLRDRVGVKKGSKDGEGRDGQG